MARQTAAQREDFLKRLEVICEGPGANAHSECANRESSSVRRAQLSHDLLTQNMFGGAEDQPRHAWLTRARAQEQPMRPRQEMVDWGKEQTLRNYRKEQALVEGAKKLARRRAFIRPVAHGAHSRELGASQTCTPLPTSPPISTQSD